MNHSHKPTSLTSNVQNNFTHIGSIVNANSRYWGNNKKIQQETQQKNEQDQKKTVESIDDHSSSDTSNSDEQYENPNFLQCNKERGATDKEVQSLAKLISFSKIEGSCAICLEQWRPQQKCSILPCTHKYHKQCIRDWLLKKNTCPCCKSIVFQ